MKRRNIFLIWATLYFLYTNGEPWKMGHLVYIVPNSMFDLFRKWQTIKNKTLLEICIFRSTFFPCKYILVTVSSWNGNENSIHPPIQVNCRRTTKVYQIENRLIYNLIATTPHPSEIIKLERLIEMFYYNRFTCHNTRFRAPGTYNVQLNCTFRYSLVCTKRYCQCRLYFRKHFHAFKLAWKELELCLSHTNRTERFIVRE